MKTLADFKRRIKVGDQLHTTYHQTDAGRDEKGVIILKDSDRGSRRVSQVKSTMFALSTKHKDGTYYDSWVPFPPAAKAQILGEDRILILDEDWRVRTDPKPLIPLMTYTFIR